MVTTQDILAKHTASLKEREMYDIVSTMRSLGITIADLTAYEATFTSTTNVIADVRKQVRLQALAVQAKDDRVIKATANSLYSRSGPKAASDYINKLGLNPADILSDADRIAAVQAELMKSAEEEDKAPPAIQKSRIVKNSRTAEEEDSTLTPPTPAQGSAPLPPIDEVLGDEPDTPVIKARSVVIDEST